MGAVEPHPGVVVVTGADQVRVGSMVSSLCFADVTRVDALSHTPDSVRVLAAARGLFVSQRSVVFSSAASAKRHVVDAVADFSSDTNAILVDVKSSATLSAAVKRHGWVMHCAAVSCAGFRAVADGGGCSSVW